MFNDKVVYQIYPKSFKDTNGNGMGDLQGIISELDYLENLGVDILWLTPIFISPQNDNGYDVEDYYKVDPLFGTDEDLEELIKKTKERGMEIMFDMVLNHSSTAHPWFQKALAGDKKYQDYYFFTKESVNWQSKFGGSAFEYVEELDLYYLHLFDKTQADLNWANDEVFQELCKIVNFWLEKGIRGFRFDVINLISKPQDFEDDLEGDGRRFYTDGRHAHEYLHRLNNATFGRYDGVMTVGELSSTSIEEAVKYANPKNEELGTIFNFHHLKVDYKNSDKWALKDFDLQEFKDIMISWQLAMQEEDTLMSLFLNNHDQPRAVSRFGDDSYEAATMLASCMQLMRGVPFIYQGEEIGLPNAYFVTIKDYRDIESLNYFKILKDTLSEAEILKILQARSRDNGRTPMPWNHSKNYGFTNSNEPWLPLSKSDDLKTVEENLKDSNSIYHFYQKLNKLRHEDDVISKGSIRFLNENHPSLLVYIRKYENKEYLHINNFYKDEVDYELINNNGRIVLNNYKRKSLEKTFQLSPYETLVIEL